MHEELKAEADAQGSNITKIVLPLIENRSRIDTGPSNARLFEGLSEIRVSDRFGEETLLQEMLRRIVSIQLMEVHNLSKEVSSDEMAKFIEEADDRVREIVSQRKTAT